ncbi:MAG: energy-coupling factor transporter ATPase [Desulfotomaculaceae bacterium]|nr:energy-coupling factor transporter ATPase [Desulfotomaculaceae bacterium]
MTMTESNGTGYLRGCPESQDSQLTAHDRDEIFIAVEDLTYIYNHDKAGGHRALSGIDLAVKAGEFLVVAGPNGSGKSTLARHFNAMLKPSGGRVIVAGMDTMIPENAWEIRRRVGMVFQNPDNQIVSSLVEEDAAFGAENLGLPSEEVKKRVEETLRLIGLSQYAKHAPHLLSGGQKQKLAIAGVLVMRPSCLVLDEPTSMLDPAGRVELMETLIRLNRTMQVTVVLVTHFMEEAVLADRVVVLSDGRIAVSGSPARVFAEVELLAELGLKLPAALEIAHGLRKRGFSLPQEILTMDDILAYLKNN